jgi:hypothetical protein
MRQAPLSGAPRWAFPLSFVALSLPNPEDCRVFVFGASALPVAWKLDPAGIDWEQATTRTRVAEDPRKPYPEYDPSPASAGFHRDSRLWLALTGSVLLASEHWRGLGLSLALAGGLALVVRLAWRWGVRRADGGLAWWRLAGVALAIGSLSLAAGLQALVLTLIVGFPPGLLFATWLVGALAWWAARQALAPPPVRPA